MGVVGQEAAIRHICDWLDQWLCDAQTLPWWPGVISVEELEAGTVNQTGPQRPSWCYGTPGITRAQQLAGLALSDARLQERAEKIFAACATDETQLSQLRDPSLCHGWGGLLQVAHHMASDACPGSELGNLIPQLHDRMNQHLRVHGPPHHDGLLEGTAGVSLAVLGTKPHGSGWQSCLLLT